MGDRFEELLVGAAKVPAAPPPAPSFFDKVKVWLLCGWITKTQFFRPGYVEVAPSKQRNPGLEPYVVPSRWTQLVRRCRAKLKRSGCWQECYTNRDDGRQALHFYKTDSYERNFDRGPEFWEDLPMIGGGVDGDEPAVSPSVPDPVWMITATQEDMKLKAAAVIKARKAGGDEP